MPMTTGKSGKSFYLSAHILVVDRVNLIALMNTEAIKLGFTEVV
jgi:hypothetical protein